MFRWLKSLFNYFIKKSRAFYKRALPEVKEIIVGQLEEFARTVTSELKSVDLKNGEKRNQAFNRIKEYAKKHSIQAKDSLIYLVVEMAYQAVRDDTVRGLTD